MLIALTAACGSSDAHTEAPSVLVGTGEWQYEPLAAGQRVQLAAGSQGGYHVWVSLRAQGFASERLRMELELVSDAAPLARSDLELPFAPVPAASAGEDGWVERVGFPAQLLEPWCAVERPLLVRVTLSDREGQSASAELTVVPTAPPGGFFRSCVTP